jgi:hypothetical protein
METNKRGKTQYEIEAINRRQNLEDLIRRKQEVDSKLTKIEYSQ